MFRGGGFSDLGEGCFRWLVCGYKLDVGIQQAIAKSRLLTKGILFGHKLRCEIHFFVGFVPNTSKFSGSRFRRSQRFIFPLYCDAR